MAPYYNNRSNTKLHTNYDFIQKLNDIKRLKKNMTHDEKKDINEKFVSNEKYFLNVLKKYTDNEEKVYKDNVFNSTTLTDHISLQFINLKTGIDKLMISLNIFNQMDLKTIDIVKYDDLKENFIKLRNTVVIDMEKIFLDIKRFMNNEFIDQFLI
jgi:hypothetical protein